MTTWGGSAAGAEQVRPFSTRADTFPPQVANTPRPTPPVQMPVDRLKAADALPMKSDGQRGAAVVTNAAQAPRFALLEHVLGTCQMISCGPVLGSVLPSRIAVQTSSGTPSGGAVPAKQQTR